MQEVLGPPECMSFVFNEDGKVSSYTGGYIMDRSAAAAFRSGQMAYQSMPKTLLPGTLEFVRSIALFADLSACHRPASCVKRIADLPEHHQN